MTHVIVGGDKATTAATAAESVTRACVDALRSRGVVHLVLTGGSMGSAVWAAVVAGPDVGAVDWSRVHVWWGDERYLPTGDPDRNDTQNLAAGLGDLGLPPDHIHSVAGPDASVDVHESAARYAGEIAATAPGGFDLCLLGVGPDGHVASLFPYHPLAATAGVDTIAVVDSPKPPPVRVSLTREALERSAELVFVVAGADKADAVRRGVAGDDPAATPAAGLAGRRSTVWLVDSAAAGGL